MYDCFTGRYSSRNSIESGKSAENRQIGGIIQSGLSRLFSLLCLLKSTSQKFIWRYWNMVFMQFRYRWLYKCQNNMIQV